MLSNKLIRLVAVLCTLLMGGLAQAQESGPLIGVMGDGAVQSIAAAGLEKLGYDVELIVTEAEIHAEMTHVLVGVQEERIEEFGVATRVQLEVKFHLLTAPAGTEIWGATRSVVGTAGTAVRARAKADKLLPAELANVWEGLGAQLLSWTPGPMNLFVFGVLPESRVAMIERLRTCLDGLGLKAPAVFEYDVDDAMISIGVAWTGSSLALDLVVADSLPELRLMGNEGDLSYRMVESGRAISIQLVGISSDELLSVAEQVEAVISVEPGLLNFQLSRDVARGALEIQVETAGSSLALERSLHDRIVPASNWRAVDPDPNFDFAYRQAGSQEVWEIRIADLAPADLGLLASPLLDFLTSKGAKLEAQRYDSATRVMDVVVAIEASPRALRAALWGLVASTPELSRLGLGTSQGRRLGFKVLSRVPDDYEVSLLVTGLNAEEGGAALAELTDFLEIFPEVRDLSIEMIEGAARVTLLYPKAAPLFLADIVSARRVGKLPFSFVPAPTEVPNVRLHFGDRVPTSTSNTDAGLPAANNLADLVDQVGGSVVTIRGSLPDGTAWNGSGFIVSSRGFLVTNDHVAGPPEGWSQADVSLTAIFQDGRQYEATWIASEPDLDLALLRLPNQGFPSVGLRPNSEAIRRGEGVVVIGAPRGLSDSVTTGIVSALDRDNGWLQTDALINPGNSGGPAFGLDGRVLGVVVAGRVQRYSTVSGTMTIADPGLNFLIPIAQAGDLLRMAGIEL
ncbi:MAG: S1-C subfamily serine protease [Planctomycetota bacterium]|jgi:S1-C subfamily serine protease